MQKDEVGIEGHLRLKYNEIVPVDGILNINRPIDLFLALEC